MNIIDILSVVSRQNFLHTLSRVSRRISSICWRTSLGKLLQYFVGCYRINIVDILSVASRWISPICYRDPHSSRFEGNIGTNRLNLVRRQILDTSTHATAWNVELTSNDTMEKIKMCFYIRQTQSKCDGQYAQKQPAPHESKINKTGNVRRSNIEGGSHKYCRSGKALNITQLECVDL